jgi:Rrf2 family protein
MYFTLEADYAVRIVHCLAQSDVRLDAKTIAERSTVTLRFALKILRKLVESGIVKSYKGTQGGYELAKSPAEISLCDVIETVEGTYHFSRCLEDGYKCSCGRSGDCCHQKAFGQITEIVKKELKARTFDKLVN